jgi:hypothetical protein
MIAETDHQRAHPVYIGSVGHFIFTAIVAPRAAHLCGSLPVFQWQLTCENLGNFTLGTDAPTSSASSGIYTLCPLWYCQNLTSRILNRLRTTSSCARILIDHQVVLEARSHPSLPSSRIVPDSRQNRNTNGLSIWRLVPMLVLKCIVCSSWRLRSHY